MVSIIRNVTELAPSERQLYECVLGEQLEQDQRVLVMVLEPGVEPDEAIRRRAMADFQQLCQEASNHRERLGVSVDEAGNAVDEAITRARRRT